MLTRKNNGWWASYDIKWPDNVGELPRTLDRFRTCAVFFDLKFPPFLVASIDARKWISWASIAALMSIREVIEIDLEEHGFLKLWKDSTEHREIQENRVLLVLKELRNFEVHFEFQPRMSHAQVDRSSVIEHIDHDSFFFTPIDWEDLSKLRNIKSGKSQITKEIVEEFNEQYAKKYSVETIITSMLDWYSAKIASFLETVKDK